VSDPIFVGIGSAQILARIARDMALQPGLSTAEDCVGERCALPAPVRHCRDLGGRRRHVIAVRAATDPVAEERTRAITVQLRQGPGWDAVHGSSPVRMADLRDEPRWPDYRSAILADEAPLLSAAAFPLEVAPRRMGALVLGAPQPEFFTDLKYDLAATFAEHASIALARVAAEEEAANLQAALVSNRRTGMAVGVLMSEHRITEQRAFELLRLASRNGHRKVRELADEVLLTGTLPDVVP
jgi:GAF domain-containing protein